MKEISTSKCKEPSAALVRQALEPYAIQPTDAQLRLIRQYTETLLLWNQKVRLTAITETREILERHFGESMFAAQVVPLCQGRLADVGSGAGFPGLALKIACPRLDVVLIEANQKKAAFLAEVRRRLRLERVKIVCKRVEELHVLPGFADFVSARALGGFPRLLRWSREALSAGGRLLLWLGVDDASKVAKTGGWAWGEAITIPNSRRRVLLIGQRKSD